MTAAWFTAQQLADLRLPGLPASKPGVLLRADREGWPFRDRAARGGGREYPVTALPPEARAALLRRELEATPAHTEPQPALPVPAPPAMATMADWQRRTMDARAAIIAEVDRLFLRRRRHAVPVPLRCADPRGGDAALAGPPRLVGLACPALPGKPAPARCRLAGRRRRPRAVHAGHRLTHFRRRRR